METYSTPPDTLSVSSFRTVPSRKRLFWLTFLSLLVAGVIGVAGLIYIKTRTSLPPGTKEPGRGGSAEDKPGSRTFGNLDRMNILILGIDNNYDRKGILYTKGARSDSMMVVSINRDAKFLNVLSIPRDLQVLISESYGYEKINAAYSVGGPQQAIRTVERFLHIPIHHYLVVKIQGAKKIIDALGGLNVDVEKNMDYDDNWGHLHVHLKKGPQMLTGEQAVGYARFRHDEESDRGRMRRQQQVIKIMVDMLKSPSIVTHFPSLAKAVKSTLETDLDISAMVDLAQLYRKFDKKQMHNGKIEGDDAMVNGVSMIIPYGPQNDKIVRELLKDAADLSLHDMRILVLNGTPEVGAGQRLADHLASLGLQVVKVDTAKRTDYKKTEITENIKNVRLHGLLTHFCPGAVLKEGSEVQGQAYDVVVTLGKDKTLDFVRSAPAPPPPVDAAPAIPRPAPDHPVVHVTTTATPDLPQAEPTSPPPLVRETPAEPAPVQHTPAAPVEPAHPSHPDAPPPETHPEPVAPPPPPPPAPLPTPAAPVEKPAPVEVPKATPLAPE